MKEGKVFKRILAIALVVVMTITMMPFGVFATEGEDATTPDAGSSEVVTPGEGETPAECAHLKDDTEYNKKIEATCTEDGVKAYYLCKCGAKVQYPSLDNPKVVTDEHLKINKLGHDWENATCAAPKTCKRCGATEGEKLDHVGGTATCTAKPVCTACGEEYGEKADHEWNDATCTAPKTCKNCNETEGTASAHTYGTDGKCTACGADCPHATLETIAGNPASCTVPGVSDGKRCADCGIVTVEQTVVPALNHPADKVTNDEGTPATCTTAGVTAGKKCSLCNTWFEGHETIDALDHSYAESATKKDELQHGKKCIRCDEYKADSVANHEWELAATIVAPTCTTKGTGTYECAGCEASKTDEIAEAAHTYATTLTKANETQHGYKCTACDDYNGLANHEYTTTHKTLPNCVTEGSETKTCACGDSKTETLPTNDDHDWGVYTETKAPTCTEKGTKEAACKREGCAEKDIKEIPALDHDMEEVAAKEATCKEAGNNKYYACDRCDKFFKDEAGAIETTVEAETIAKGEHKFTKYNVVKDATCEANAVEKATCDVCEEATHERPIPGTMLAHTFKDYKSDGNATCKVDGTMTAVCEMCKEAKDTKTEVDSHKTAPHTPDAAGVKCTLCGEMLVCLHTYSAEKLITKTPTCTTEGQKAIVCSKCKANKPGSEEVIPATGHAWDEGEVIKAATCKEKGTMKHKCNNKCGETKTEEIAVVPHNYKEEITHATCTEDGYSTFTCTMCGSHYVDKPVEAYGHMFDIYFYDEGSATCYQDGTKTAECANGCGTKNTIADPGSKTDHEMTDFTVIKAATCTEDGEEEAKCFYYDKCGYSELVPVDALGHDIPADFVTVTEPTCTEKGLKTKTCTRCPETVATEEIPALGHDIAAEYTVDVAPTCTTTGKQSKHCSRCDYKESEEEIPATGHNYKPGEGTTATCTEPGKAVYVCTVCGDSYSEDSVPALGHDFDYVSDGNATCTADGTKTGKCIRCDATSTVADEGSKLEHVLETTVEKASTEKAGLKITKCANCEYEESVEIAKIDSLKLKYEVVAYDGKYKRPSLTITDADGNKLVKGEDYILDLPAKDECINAGTYTYTVYFQGDYEGEETLSYKIVPGKANKIVSKETKQTYIQLKWSTVKGADGYRIYVKTSSGGWKKLATVKGTTTYKVKDLKAGTKYTFAVKAFSKSEDGETTIWATEFAQQSFKTLPGKTSKIAVKTSKNAVKLTWKEVKGAEGYRVYVKTAKGGWKTVSTVKGKTTYTIKDLKANTTYEYAVKAYYKDGSATVWSNQYTTVKAKTAK